MSAIGHHELQDTLAETENVIGLNHAQRTRLANPSPERDSLLEHLLHWRDTYRIPDQEWITVGKLLGEVIHLNDHEFAGERQIAGALTDWSLVTNRHVARPMKIKDLAKALREPLLVLASPAGRTADALIAARRAVTDIAAITPSERLLSDSLRHELRPTAHDVLVAMVQRAVQA